MMARYSFSSVFEEEPQKLVLLPKQAFQEKDATKAKLFFHRQECLPIDF